MGVSWKVRVWVWPENWDRFGKWSWKLDRVGVVWIPWMVKVNCLELERLVTLSIMKLLLDQEDLGTLNSSEKVPC